MSKLREIEFQSKVCRGGNLKRTFDFAVRGLPRHFLPDEKYVDVGWAYGVYQREIHALDELDIHPMWFSSGVLGAALISLKLHPRTHELWRRIAQHEVHRDKRGADAAGFLRDLIERHQNDQRLTRSQNYQMFLFQATLAMAKAWVHHGDPDHRYLHLPPIPDAPKLLAEVRASSNERHAQKGFRPPKVTRKHWVELPVPEVVHEPDEAQLEELTRRAASLETDVPDDEALQAALDWVAQDKPPAELAHPAALAAAALSVIQVPESQALWSRAFQFQGCRKPNHGSKPLSDASVTLIDCIRQANRSNEPDRAATELYSRVRLLVNLWHQAPDGWRQSLPRAPKVRPLDALWADLSVNFVPRIIFECERPELTLSSDPGEPDPNGSKRASRRKKSGPETARKRMDTGRRAEEWFMANYQSVCTEFRDVRLIDCRDRQSGYDFRLMRKRGDWYVEIKSQREGIGIQLTDRQWIRARLEGENYFLVIVRNVPGQEPEAQVIRNPFVHLKAKKRVPEPAVIWIVGPAELRRVIEGNP